jgi:propanol-preferring alcohol dehydrogenase
MMRAMVLEKPKQELKFTEVPIPHPGKHQVLIAVHTCGVCHTDLHILDGELSEPKIPLIPGHQIVGSITKLGEKVTRFQVGTRVGVPWLGAVDGTCRYCLSGQENLCDHPTFTGYQIDGGFAEYCVVDEQFCFPLPDQFSDLQAAPLLCAGLIGYRTYRMAGSAARVIGIYGFGAAAHLVTQVALYEGRRILAFTRPGDVSAQEFALSLGASWAGDSTQVPPEELDAALIFAPLGSLVINALKAVVKGGVVVCGGIHMTDIPSFPYLLLWEERLIRSVANLTRRDGEEFLALASKIPIHSTVTSFPLEKANDALDALREGKLTGSAVIQVADLS